MAAAAAATAIVLLLLLPFTSASLVSTPNPTLQYHHGHLLTGNLTLHLIWYGHFSPSQRSIITDFLLSLSENYYVRCPDSSDHQSRHVKSLRYTRNPVYPGDVTRVDCHPDRNNSPSLPPPSVSSWWATTRLYLSSSSTNLHLSPQLLLSSYPLGRSLSSSSLTSLASLKMEEGEGRGENSLPSSSSSISILLTSSDVVVDGFCSSRCGTHSRLPNAAAFIWVGDSSAQCPGQCAWPFHQPPYGPQSPPLVSPTGDVGADGMVINLATLLAGTVTNPDGKGFFQGPPEAPLEAVSACTGIFGSGAYPGFPGKVLVDPTSGASYNAQGVNGRKYLLPAMWDPRTSQCATLV